MHHTVTIASRTHHAVVALDDRATSDQTFPCAYCSRTSSPCQAPTGAAVSPDQRNLDDKIQIRSRQTVRPQSSGHRHCTRARDRKAPSSLVAQLLLPPSHWRAAAKDPICWRILNNLSSPWGKLLRTILVQLSSARTTINLSVLRREPPCIGTALPSPLSVHEGFTVPFQDFLKRVSYPNAIFSFLHAHLLMAYLMWVSYPNSSQSNPFSQTGPLNQGAILVFY